jgi:ubiquinone/menaquinone biosynthesis C-methylase UbiE
MENPDLVAAFARQAVELAPPSGMVLDFGSGTARGTIGILRENLNLQLIVTDISLNRLKIAETNIADADVNHKAWIRHITEDTLPFPDRVFDMVISDGFLHRLPAPGPILRELHRVCKPGAGLLVRDWLRPGTHDEEDEWMHAFKPVLEDYQIQMLRRAMRASFTLEEVGRLARDAGFADSDISRTEECRWMLWRRWKNAPAGQTFLR